MSADMKMRRRAITDLLLIVLFVVIFGSSYLEAQAHQPSKPKIAALSAPEKVEAEQRLWDLGYWAGPVDGKFDAASRHALIAFQKVERRARTGNFTLDELDALRNAGRPAARHGNYAHVEIDLERQVLFLIDETGAVMRVLPVSTGSGKLYVDQGRVQRAQTPTGTFKVLRKIKGWRLSTLGLLYYPNYIYNGIAIHGSPSVPSRPASHGCIRIPMFAAKDLSSLLPVGMQVEVYAGKG
jgi:N-acetylmuramoyl-L-alanine amidase